MIDLNQLIDAMSEMERVQCVKLTNQKAKLAEKVLNAYTSTNERMHLKQKIQLLTDERESIIRSVENRILQSRPTA